MLTSTWRFRLVTWLYNQSFEVTIAPAGANTRSIRAVNASCSFHWGLGMSILLKEILARRTARAATKNESRRAKRHHDTAVAFVAPPEVGGRARKGDTPE